MKKNMKKIWKRKTKMRMKSEAAQEEEANPLVRLRQGKQQPQKKHERQEEEEGQEEKMKNECWREEEAVMRLDLSMHLRHAEMEKERGYQTC